MNINCAAARRADLVLCGLLMLFLSTLPRAMAQAPEGSAVVALPPLLRQGRNLLEAQQFTAASHLFSAYLHAHPNAVQAQLGLGDAQAGLHQWEAAEATYRAAVAAQPELWQAHKDLVVVEAALGRWEEFDRERTVLRMARQRGAPGITAGESDLIDRFQVGGAHWIARAYFEPVGRSRALYNFEQFNPQGRVEAYVSLEDQAAARAALTPGDVRIGAAPSTASAAAASSSFALNWYTGTGHGTIRTYPGGEPTYEQLRRDVIHWLQRHPQNVGTFAGAQPETHRSAKRTSVLAK